MSWKVVTISPDDMAAGRAMELQNGFAAIWMSVGAPPSAAMYGDKSIADDRKFHFYFTPAAALLALAFLESFGAVDCPNQDATKLAVHVANSGAGRNG